ncbi:hypothetical protein N7462_007416 [Penicillium macrosclerotiorum]|uniref:uncharacterized protein n=1 Tax=Penicillium macrosclerotiorum TaxID=303699 RepID=UPI00254928F4|nr:uncharacterized protein N7462_007416 [Penicillium macrosclerotiorum]KAJ5679172.1 hypothetical protein N7462_007416 [Penicillium macrosclerotiorum]
MSHLDNPSTSSCRFSTRISLRWLPEPAQETTDTVVMSVKDWYLDLRMDKQTGGIDWAIAGQRLIESQEPLRVSFTHELDSHDAFESADCGTFVSLPNGDDLETGSMPRPDIPGAPMTDYEEAWRELPFRAGPEGEKKGLSWILESVDGGAFQDGEEVTVTKKFLGRIWGTYLALQQTQTHRREKTATGDWVVRKTGAEVSARREEWSSGWKGKYVVGPSGDTLPSMIKGLEGEGQGAWRTVDGNVHVQGEPYIVRAFEEIE